MSRRSPWFLMMLLMGTPLAARDPAIDIAREAVESGDVILERDLAPLIEALASSRDVDEKRQLVDAISDLAAADSDSTNATKSYLQDKATPLLLEVIKTGKDPFLQGDAVFALRGMGVSRSILEQAATLAEADANEYVQSRGEILRGFIGSMPIEQAAAERPPVDPVKAKAGVAYLDKRGIKISTDALRKAAGRADPETVRALLDVGVHPDTGVSSLTETPIYYATFAACSSQGAETEWLVETVRLLVDAGADLTFVDDGQNTVMMHAATQCGPKIVEILAKAGAKVDSQNGSGLSPLALALLMQKLEAAEALIDYGARLTEQEGQMLSSSASDERAAGLIRRARGG